MPPRDPSNNCIKRAVIQAHLIDPSESDLHKAIRANDYNTLRHLIDNHADINVQESYARTPLTLAIELNAFNLAALLLKSGAEYSLLPRTPLQHADVDVASNPALAPAFRLALLKIQIST